jgi:hypothetical protein
MLLTNDIELLISKALRSVNEYIDMLYIQAISKARAEDKEDVSKTLDTKEIENYLKRKGYTLNYVSGKPVMVKGFTCCYAQKDSVEIWHDVPNRKASVFIHESVLTGLPITLNYMERI